MPTLELVFFPFFLNNTFYPRYTRWIQPLHLIRMPLTWMHRLGHSWNLWCIRQLQLPLLWTSQHHHIALAFLCWNPQGNCMIALWFQSRGIHLEIAYCIIRLLNRIKSIASMHAILTAVTFFTINILLLGSSAVGSKSNKIDETYSMPLNMG